MDTKPITTVSVTEGRRPRRMLILLGGLCPLVGIVAGAVAYLREESWPLALLTFALTFYLASHLLVAFLDRPHAIARALGAGLTVAAAIAVAALGRARWDEPWYAVIAALLAVTLLQGTIGNLVMPAAGRRHTPQPGG